MSDCNSHGPRAMGSELHFIGLDPEQGAIGLLRRIFSSVTFKNLRS